MRIAIIGGSGFIGSYTLLELSKHHNDVTIIDIRQPKKSFITHLDFNFIECDICDRDKIKSIITQNDFDVVYHFAGLIRADDCRKRPVESCDLNLTGLINVLEACRSTGIKRFIFSSTTHIYSQCSDRSIVYESDVLTHNLHLYPGNKLCAESIIMSYHMLYGLPYTILRYSVAIGPYGHRDNVLSNFIIKSLKHEDITVYNNGQIYRDFMYVEDHARGNVLALKPSAENEIINISTSNLKLLDVAKSVVRKTNSNSKIITAEYNRVGDHDKIPIVSNSKARKLLQWEPKYNIDHMIEQCTLWHRYNQLPLVDIAKIISKITGRVIYTDSKPGDWDSLEALNIAITLENNKCFRRDKPIYFQHGKDVLAAMFSDMNSVYSIINKK
jgi:UDP-glucose 4-epimerase